MNSGKRQPSSFHHAEANLSPQFEAEKDYDLYCMVWLGVPEPFLLQQKQLLRVYATDLGGCQLKGYVSRKPNRTE